MVEASIGHIMDLPKNDIGVELEKRTFEPDADCVSGQREGGGSIEEGWRRRRTRSIWRLTRTAKARRLRTISRMQLGTNAKDRKKIRRVTFNEITKKAVQEAFKHARDIDQNLVDAQQTRRVLDRLVGYQISPLLWDKVRRGLVGGPRADGGVAADRGARAGDRAFQPVEYWTMDAQLHPEKQAEQEFKAQVYRHRRRAGARCERHGQGRQGTVHCRRCWTNGERTDAVVAQLEKAKWSVASVEPQGAQRNPMAPFITSKLQQDASSQLGFNVRRTMGVAQRLYEGVEIGTEGTVGLITYMRTDSTRVAPDAIVEAREYIRGLGKQYLPEKPNVYAGKKEQAQDAHEAIRPTRVDFTPDSIRASLSDEQYRLYKMIWQRFVSSQMTPAVFDQTTVDIAAKADRTYDFRATGSTLKFDGFLKVWDGGSEDSILPELNAAQELEKISVNPEQKFTQPPPRYNEASLVKVLEERGIGRPSTYASIINTIQDRDYVKKIQAKFVPTEIGTVVTKLLVKNFPYIFDTAYTAKLESELDAVEEGHERWTDLLNGFYDHFEEELAVAGEHMEDIKRMEEPTKEICDKCGSPLVLKWGKFGSFYSCSNYTKKKPVTVAMAPWKKDPKAVTKKITKALHFPMTVRVTEGDASVFAKEVADSKELVAVIGEAIEDASGKGRKVAVEQVSCDFTKENFAAKPDLSAPGADDVPEKEFCDNCGKEMVLKNATVGAVHELPGLLRRPALPDDPQTDAEGAAEAAGATGRGLSEMRQAVVATRRSVRGVYCVQRLSEVQVCEAGAAGCSVPEGRRGYRGAEDAARRRVLRLHQLSQVRLCQQPEAGKPGVSEMRQRLPAGGGEREGNVPGVPEQSGGAAETAQAQRRSGGREAGHAGVQLSEEDRAAGDGAGADSARSGEDTSGGAKRRLKGLT